jgi:hypothetical protein
LPVYGYFLEQPNNVTENNNFVNIMLVVSSAPLQANLGGSSGAQLSIGSHRRISLS